MHEARLPRPTPRVHVPMIPARPEDDVSAAVEALVASLAVVDAIGT